ncbi:MAG: ABC transporter ATP-binding protein [Paenibacillaceae bacterium]|nr:MAG: ABC transporter ATP-binding protein [Paenibacillaceae bacterium]
MITIRNLTKKYGNRTILDNVSITIPDGEITFLMGSNGQGKTTLIKCILNLERYEGRIRYDNKPIQDVRKEIAVVHDDSPLYGRLTGLENIYVLAKERDYEKITTVSRKFVSDNVLREKTSKYSYGQKKKLSIIIALLKNPKYLFMDEVSNGLDYESVVMLRETLCEYKNKCTVFLTGHNFDFYDRIATNILLLKDRKIMPHVREAKEARERLEEIYVQNFGNH